MSDYLRRPLGKSLNALATKRAQDAIQQLGRSLPCVITTVVSSGVVTVRFDVDAAPFTLPQVTIPVQASEFVRLPLQVGMKGLTIPADVRLGFASGLGGGVPNLTRPANLAALTFVPLGNAGWSAPDDTQAVVIYGPNGAIIRTANSSHKITVNSTGVNLDGNVKLTPTTFGAFGATPVTKRTLTGLLSSVTDPNAKLCLTSIINALTTLGWTNNNTT